VTEQAGVFEKLFECSVDGVLLVQPGGVVLRANPAACRALGRTEAELRAMRRAQFVVEDAPLVALLARRTATGSVTGELTFLRPDGSTFPADFTSGLLPAEAGAPGLSYVIFRDATDRKRQETERERLARALEQAEEMVVVADAGGTIVYVNPAFERVTGYGRAEVAGRNLLAPAADEVDAIYPALHEAVTARQPWQGRFANRKKDGTAYHEEARVSLVRDAAGAIESYVAVKRDITRDLALEAQLVQSQKLETVGRLAGGVAHDFNNLLSVILSYSGFALEQLGPDSPIRGELEEIEGAGRRAASLTRQLLAFSRKQVLQPVALQLNQGLGEMEKMLRRLVGEDVELRFDLAPGLGVVTADPGQVEQVVMNLAVNSRDAMPGGGRLTIATANVELGPADLAGQPALRPGPYVQLVVSDTGSGMDEATRAHLFEPFFTTKAAGKGSGLGLSTVYGIVRQSGGCMLVESAPGAGTTFRIYLPRQPEAQPEVRPAPAAARTGGAETVLVVEDDPVVLAVARRILESGGYRVLTAAGGAAGLELCERHPGEIQLVLTDVVMPQMGGRAFAETLRKARPGIKVVFMSGYTDEALVNQGVTGEGLAFIVKPFTQALLLRRVRQVLDE